MAIITHKGYKRSKAKNEKIIEKQRTEKPSSVSISETPAKVTPKTYVLQDPDSRTFKDSIVLDGKKIERDVVRGKLITQDESLRGFLMNKGWILLDVTQ